MPETTKTLIYRGINSSPNPEESAGTFWTDNLKLALHYVDRGRTIPEDGTLFVAPISTDELDRLGIERFGPAKILFLSQNPVGMLAISGDELYSLEKRVADNVKVTNPKTAMEQANTIGTQLFHEVLGQTALN